MTNHSIRILAVCAALAAPALTSSAPALAQGAPAASGTVDAASLKKARELFEQGNAFYDANKYPQAEAAYLAAWNIRKSYDVAANFGNLEADMNKPRQALEYMSYALREFPAGGKPAIRDALAKRIGETRALVGVLRVQVNRPGVEVTVDGRPLGPSPLPEEVFIEAGTHQVEATLAGFPKATATVTVVKGKAQEVPITLEETGPSTAVVAAGGAVAGAAAVAGVVMAILSASKGSSATTLRASLTKSGGCASTTDPACAGLRSALDGRATFGNAAIGSFVGAGVVGVATLIFGLSGGSKTSRVGLAVLPVMTADGGGLVIGGTF